MKTKISVLVLAALCAVSMSACNSSGSAVIAEQAEKIEQLEGEAAELQVELDNERSRADELQRALDDAITAKPESSQEAPSKPEEKEKTASSSAAPDAISSVAPAPPVQPESKPAAVASSAPPPPTSSAASSVPPVSQPQASSSSSGVTFSFGGSGGAVSSSSSTSQNGISHERYIQIVKECAEEAGLEWDGSVKDWGGFDPGVTVDARTEEGTRQSYRATFKDYAKLGVHYVYGEITMSRHGYYVFVLYR